MTKERINKVMQSGIALLAVIALLMLADECRAFPYRPSRTLNLLSEYGFNDSVPPHSRIWKVVPEVRSRRRIDPAVFHGSYRPKRAPCVNSGCPRPGSAGDIRWKGMGRADKRKAFRAFCFCPVFPRHVMFSRSASAAGSTRRRVEAGGRVFSKSYRVTFDAVSVADAKSMGWVKVENPGQAGLIMVAVTDGKGRPVVKQLWPADGSWWIYEETSLRRSWLIH